MAFLHENMFLASTTANSNKFEGKTFAIIYL
jgi:hypothetical protein